MMEENIIPSEKEDAMDLADAIIAKTEINPKIERAKAIGTLIVVCVINVLNLYGYAIDVEAAVKIIGTLAATASIVVAWWKNQNLTTAAMAGQAVVNDIKGAKHALKEAA